MGLVYLKTGKPKYAEHHFRRAAEINPTNAVLLCCIGMVSLHCIDYGSSAETRFGQVLEQSEDTVQALSYFEQACRYAPDSPMVSFKRIRLLVRLQRIEVSRSTWITASGEMGLKHRATPAGSHRRSGTSFSRGAR